MNDDWESTAAAEGGSRRQEDVPLRQQRTHRLEEFEQAADDLLRLEALGYVEGCEALNETRTGRRYVDRVHVRGGITEAGREELKKLS